LQIYNNRVLANEMTRTLLVIAAIATVLAVGAYSLGHMALAAETTTVTKTTNNSGVNVPTETNQKQYCQSAGGTSGISGSCIGTSTDTVTQSGGILKK
jgi:hypothetical protein